MLGPFATGFELDSLPQLFRCRKTSNPGIWFLDEDSYLKDSKAPRLKELKLIF
jgi:hypothetical protein